MKQQLLMTLACLSLAVASCANKDSYRPVSGGGSSSGGSGGNGGEQTVTSEQAALDLLAQDQTFSQLSGSEESLELKAGTEGVQAELFPVHQPVQGNPIVPGVFSMQLVILDRESENCATRQIIVPSFKESDLLSGQVKVNGVGRVVCIDAEECNDVLLYIEKTENQVVTASTAVRLSKGEDGVFRPAQNESSVFANAQNIEDSVSQCMARRQKTVSAYQEYAQSRIAGQRAAATPTPAASTAPTVDAELARLQQLTKDIQAIEAQITNNAPTVNSQLRARLAALKSQRSDLIRQRQVRAYQLYGQSRVAGNQTAAAPATAATTVDAELARLQQLTKDIQAIEAQITNNAPTVNSEMRSRLAALKSQRSDLIRQRQVRAYQQYGQSRTAGQAPAQTGGSQVVDPLAQPTSSDAEPVSDRR